MAPSRKTVFVSYAHEDRKWADELMTFLSPWIRDKRVELWDDSRIPPGARWRDDIDAAMDDAAVGVLLVSSRFFASPFIAQHELPVLLERAAGNQLRLFWIPVSHSPVTATGLRSIQAASDPARPLDTLSRPQRNKVLVDIAQQIADAVTMRTFAGGLNVIDETTEPLAAALEKRPEQPKPSFRVQAVYEPAQDRIAFTGTLTTITIADVSRLPEADREFIADLEDSLVRNYRRWREVRQHLGDAGGALDAEVERELERLAKLMCADLNAILGFLRTMHKAELEDHYGRYRYICSELAKH